MKTIRQIADELGVSKQAVSYRLKQLEATKENGVLATKENGVLVVSLAGETLIKSTFNENNRQSFGDKQPPKDRQKENDILAVLQSTITVLQGQIEVKDTQLSEKDKQLAEKDRQLSDITSALVAAQQTAATAQALHAGTLQQQLIGSSADELPADEPTDDTPEPQKEEKRGFFGLFRRKP
jgi:DNA-binding MarR family transcriptional regulator